MAKSRSGRTTISIFQILKLSAVYGGHVLVGQNYVVFCFDYHANRSTLFCCWRQQSRAAKLVLLPKDWPKECPARRKAYAATNVRF